MVNFKIFGKNRIPTYVILLGVLIFLNFFNFESRLNPIPTARLSSTRYTSCGKGVNRKRLETRSPARLFPLK